MKNYLKDFFIKQGYEKEDALFLLSAYEKIEENEKAYALWNKALKTYEENECCDFKEIIRLADLSAELTGVHEYTAELLIFICLSRRLRELYTEKGIDLSIYERTVSDLKYKLNECKLVYGIVGSFVAGWFSGFFNLTRFALGRLQFEVIPFNFSYEKNGITLTPEDKIIAVHIPRSGEQLTKESCDKAFLMAKEFFKDTVSTEPCPFVCHSWLLYPEMENLAPKGSNVYRFFRSFDIFDSVIDKSRADLWRLFDTKELNIEKLPADTSLRRAFIEHLKNGGKLGIGRGVLFV